MLLKRGIRKNSGGIEIRGAKTLINSGTLPEIANGEEAVLGVGSGALSARKFCMFLLRELNFWPILIKMNAFETWHRKLPCKK